MIIGYARTSAVDQVTGFEAQLRELDAANCTKIFQEQVSSMTDAKPLRKTLTKHRNKVLEGHLLALMY
jgi:DNA invertase Pin-like site-specific DNA recombinase